MMQSVEGGQNKRVWIFLSVATMALIVFTVFFAPSSGQTDGSTYGRSPGGYGAWYRYVQEQRGVTVERWQKPLRSLIEMDGEFSLDDGSVVPLEDEAEIEPTESPTTLLRISPINPPFIGYELRHWVQQGHRLILVGMPTPATKAPFQTVHDTDSGSVTIETRRRKLHTNAQEQVLLADEYGVLVWQESMGLGDLIVVTAPFLAANAYQDSLGNYDFLADLAIQPDHRLLVDEYIHGYRDEDVVLAETGGSWVAYLAQTPVLLVLVQLGVIVAIAMFASNRRFGLPAILTQPSVNNSMAYIKALAAILQKAGTTDFVVDLIGREERRRLQQALGLGRDPVDQHVILEVWQRKSDRPVRELQQLLDALYQNQRIRDKDLLVWLEKIQQIHHHLPPTSRP